MTNSLSNHDDFTASLKPIAMLLRNHTEPHMAILILQGIGHTGKRRVPRCGFDQCSSKAVAVEA